MTKQRVLIVVIGIAVFIGISRVIAQSPEVKPEQGQGVIHEQPGPDYQPISVQERIRIQTARDSEAMAIERQNAAARERRPVPPIVPNIRHNLDRLSPRLRSLADIIALRIEGGDTASNLPSLNLPWSTKDHATGLSGIDANSLSFTAKLLSGSLHISVTIYDSPVVAIHQALRPHARLSLAPTAMIDNPVGPNSTLFRYDDGVDIWAAQNGVFVQVTLQQPNILLATTENQAKAILTEIITYLRR